MQVFLVLIGFKIYAQYPNHQIQKPLPKWYIFTWKLIILQKKGLKAGHQDNLAYGVGWVYEKGHSDVKDFTVEEITAHGWELCHLEPGDPWSLESLSDCTTFIFITRFKMNQMNNLVPILI